MTRYFRFAAVAVILSLAACASLEAQVARPTAEISSFSLERIGLRDLDFQFELTVKNPYPVELNFSGMTLDFSVEGAQVFQTKSQGGFRVPANRTAANKFTVTLRYEDIIRLVKNYLDKDWLDTQIAGKLTIPLPRLPGLPADISFDYRLSQKVPAIKPRVEIRNFSVSAPSEQEVAKALAAAGRNVDPKEAAGFLMGVAQGRPPAKAPIKPQDIDVPFTISYTLAITNEAKAPLSFDALDYELFIGGQSLAKGSSSQVTRQGTATLVTVKTFFSSKSLSEGIQAVLAAKRGSFRITGKASLILPPEVRRTPAPLSFDESGEFRF